MQAQHPGLTLTGMYNVLEKLRQQRGPHTPCAVSPDAAAPEPHRGLCGPLSDKERLIHDQGLVSLLRQLHDDLDEAVFAAYGWPATLSDAEILQRLVTLNAQRAAEEQRGIIHWLRPEYQNGGQRAKDEESDELPLKSKPKEGKGQGVKGQEVKKPGAKQPWPKPLAERIRATEQALHAAGHAVTAEELAARFSRAKAADLQEILESLVTLGRARRDGEKFAV